MIKPAATLKALIQWLPVNIRRNGLSLIALWFVFLSIAGINLKTREWENPIRIIQDDVHLYYSYLPAVFVHHDLTFGFFTLNPDYQRKFWIPEHPVTGVRIPKMSMGMAIVYAPFFLAAHYVIMPVSGLEAGVYALPYKIMLVVASMVYLFLGLWLLRKLLLKYFSGAAVAITLVVVTFGTNILWYTTHEPAMSHIFSFALILLMTVQTQRWLSKPGIVRSLQLGLLFGLIVLIRPTNIIFGTIILFMPGDADYRFGERVQFIFGRYKMLLIMVAGFLLVWAPQLVFWKFASGSWFYYTYGEEGFFFGNPQVFSSLFSWRKGWLVYTPLMMLTFAGLPLLFRKSRALFSLVTILLVLLIWVNASWWCWWFGGSFGNRPYIDGYGIFAFGIAAVFQALFSARRPVWRFLPLLPVVFFVLLSAFQQWQYRQGIIHYDAMTRAAYSDALFRVSLGPDLDASLVDPDYASGVKGIYYPLHEISNSDRQKRNHKILINRSYLEIYLKKQAGENQDLMRRIIAASRQPVDSAAAIEQWVDDEIARMRK